MLAHRVAHEVVEHRDQLLEDHLCLAGALGEALRRNVGEDHQDHGHHQKRDRGLRHDVADLEQGNITTQLLQGRDGENDSRTADVYQRLFALGGVRLGRTGSKQQRRDYKRGNYQKTYCKRFRRDVIKSLLFIFN